MLNFSWNHSKLIMQKIAKYNWHFKIDPEYRLIRKLKRFGNRIGNVTKMVKINYRLLSFFNNQLLTTEFDEKVRKIFYTIKLFMGWAAGQHSCKNNNWTIRILFLTRRWQKNKGTPMCNLQTKMAKKSPRKMSNALDKVHFLRMAWCYPITHSNMTQTLKPLLHDRALYPWHVSKIYCSAKSSTWHLPRLQVRLLNPAFANFNLKSSQQILSGICLVILSRVEVRWEQPRFFLHSITLSILVQCLIPWLHQDF